MIKWAWLDGWTFLHLKGGFWIITVPLVIFWIYVEWCNKDKLKGNLNSIDDFIEPVEIEELPIYTFEFKVNQEEKWKIGQVLKRMDYKNIDDLVKNIVYDFLK